MFASDRTYQDLLGGLAATATDIWADCLFVDPVSDIALLGPPDDQILLEQFKDYEAFVSELEPLSLRAAQGGEQGWLLSLDAKRWFSCAVETWPAIWIEKLRSRYWAACPGRLFWAMTDKRLRSAARPVVAVPAIWKTTEKAGRTPVCVISPVGFWNT
jgi:hypothetical protein